MRKTALVRLTARLAFPILALLAFVSPTEARYKFDDVYGASGHDPQWMVLVGNGGTNTFGDAALQYDMDVSADLVTNKNHAELINGHPAREDDIIYDGERPIHSMFLVLSSMPGQLTVNFNSPNFDAITPDTEILGDDIKELYSISKNSREITDKKIYHTDAWKQFVFKLGKKKRLDTYESVVGKFAFHQNPSSSGYSTPSQSLPVPFVIANVYDGTADMAARLSSMRTSPLMVRAILYNKDDYKEKNIVASRLIDDWFVNKNKNVGDDDNDKDSWVLVPTDSSGNATDTYYLALEVINRTGARYAVHRHDGYDWRDFPPTYWKFDIPYTQINGAVPSRFTLDTVQPVIAPGLVTVYNRKFDIDRPGSTSYARLRLYTADAPSDTYELILYYRLIPVTSLGSYSVADSNGDNLAYKVHGYVPYLENEKKFLEEVKSSDLSGGMDVKFLDPDKYKLKFNENTIYNTKPGVSTINPFRVTFDVPSEYQGEAATAAAKPAGLLPLEVTFHITSTESNHVNKNWDEIVADWHNTGDIYTTFKKFFSINLSCPQHEDVDDNPWELIEELERASKKEGKGIDRYRDLIKLSLDESKGVLSVSFSTILLDGTRDDKRPALILVSDSKWKTDNAYMVIADGYKNNAWDLEYYIAPAGYNGPNYPEDKDPDQANNNNTNGASGGGGGGCSSFGALALAALAVAALMRRK